MNINKKTRNMRNLMYGKDKGRKGEYLKGKEMTPRK